MKIKKKIGFENKTISDTNIKKVKEKNGIFYITLEDDHVIELTLDEVKTKLLPAASKKFPVLKMLT